MPQSMKIPDARAAVDKEWKKLETIPAWDLGKVQSNKEVFLEAQRDKHKVHFATPKDICHQKKMRSWNQNYRSIKAESWCSEGTFIVKDDSGAYAVFTRQGLSASQMTARL